MRYSKERIDEAFKKLPESVQDAVLSTETDEAIQEIGKRFSLHIDTMGSLVEEATYVMVGLEPASSFAQNVKSHTNVPPEKVDQVVAALNQGVFESVRSSLKEQTAPAEASEEPEEMPEPPKAAPDTVPKNLPVASDTTRPHLEEEQASPEEVLTQEPEPAAPPEKVPEQETRPEIEPEEEPAIVTPPEPAPAQPTPPEMPEAPVASTPAEPKQPEKQAINPAAMKLGASAPKKSEETASPETPKKREYGASDPYREPIDPEDLNPNIA